MSLETDDLPPVPQHTAPIQADVSGSSKFHQAWLGWFIQAREKINLINDSIRNLSKLIAGGFAVKSTDGTWAARTIQGTTNRITVANGDGIAGDPVIDLAARPDTGVGAALVKTTFDSFGRREGTQAVTNADIAPLVVVSAITNGDTTHAPSGDAVFDALALKFDKTGGTIGGNTIVTGTLEIERSAGSAQSLTAVMDGIANSFASASDPSAAKELIFNCTTDASHTTPTGGSVGVRMRILGVDRWRATTAAWFPGADNAYSLGIAPARPSEIFAASATINTSDAREKAVRGPLNAQELAAAQELASAGVIYQWNAAIAEKGYAARLHCSPTVQSVIGIMESHGLDPFRYGFVCYDEWDELPELRDEEGQITQKYRPAGDRYSLRPSELESFIAAGMAHRMDALEARLTAAGF